jgi:dTDP-glucose 4,6-dehydratase
MTLIDMAKEIIALTNSKSNIIYEPLPIDDPKQRRPDISRAQEILNWQPKVSRKEGLEKTIGYYQSLFKEHPIT